MRTKEEVIKKLKLSADAFLVANNETHEAICLTEMRQMFWFLE